MTTRLMQGLLALAAAMVLSGAGPADAQDKLKLAIGQKGNWDTSFPYMGQQKGFFKEANLELDIQWTDGGADTLQAVITGSFDAGLANGILGVVGAWSKNAPVILLSGQMLGAPDIYWYVKADSPIKSLKDLDGKSMGFSRPGSSTHAVGLALLKTSGANIKLVPAGGIPATLTQVMSGQLDAGWAAAPLLLDQVKDGKIRAVVAGNEGAGVSTQTVRVNITNAQTYNNRKDALRRFQAAYKKSIDWMYEGGAESAEAYAKFANIDPALVPELRTKYFPKASVALDKIGDIDVIIKDAVEAKRLDKALTAEQVQAFLRPVAELNR
jgi:NitT/TauT family transport system substrate-binding protein